MTPRCENERRYGSDAEVNPCVEVRGTAAGMFVTQ